MGMRESIDGKGTRHRGLIPNVARIDNLLISSAIAGFVPGTYEFPRDFEEEVANIFRYVREDVEAASGSLDQVIKIAFWLSDPDSQKEVLNDAWTTTFPDPASRPARHVHQLPGASRGRIHAEFMAVLSGQ